LDAYFQKTSLLLNTLTYKLFTILKLICGVNIINDLI
jgi:hypothetical protein